MRHRFKPEDAPGLPLLERLMRHYRFTTRDMARIAGASRSTISRIVRGEIPRLDVALRMAKAFHVPVEDLWSLPEEEPAQNHR